MSKRGSDMIKELESLGYGYDRTNSKGLHFYVHEDTGCELKVPAGTREDITRDVLRQAYRLIGLPTKDNKRNPAAIRERNAAEHARAANELERMRSELDDRRRAGADELRTREAEEAFLKAERKFRYWDRMMRQVAS